MWIGVLALNACNAETTPEKAPTPAPEPFKPPTPVQEALAGGPYPTLLVAQAQFYKDPANPKKPIPGAALLTIWRKTDTGWASTKLEDADSNVFHKAMPFHDGILTIGAEKALLKKWTFKDGAWNQETLWAPAAWGGKFNRLRDVEIGDVNGDGQDDIVMATHDAGVVAVGSFKDGKLEVVELDKVADTFVHEIEIGDVDGNGKLEFYATPTGRNRASGESQPGSVVRYEWDGTTYTRTPVEEFAGSHAKEILVVKLDPRKSRAELFASIEAHTEIDPATKKAKEVEPVEIRHYRLGKGGTWTHEVALTIPEARQNRFLCPGDFDGDGRIEIIAAAMKTGIYVLDEGADKKWTPTNIETTSSGFEHTCFGADLDENGMPELYVASDDQRELRSYAYNPATGTYDKTVLGPIAKDTITWNITTGKF